MGCGESKEKNKIAPDKGGFQLEFISISRVINHMTCEVMSKRMFGNDKLDCFRDKNDSVYFIGLASETDVIQLM